MNANTWLFSEGDFSVGERPWAFMSNRVSPQWELAVFLIFLRSSVCLSVTFLGQMMAKIVIPSTSRAYTFKR